MGGRNFWPLWSGLLFKHLKITRLFILVQLTSCWHWCYVLIVLKEYLFLLLTYYKKPLSLTFILVDISIIITGGSVAH